jgi:hypothetical protein
MLGELHSATVVNLENALVLPSDDYVLSEPEGVGAYTWCRSTRDVVGLKDIAHPPS